MATIVGTEGDDVLTGSHLDDVIVGLGGNDIIDSKSGIDTICGGDGDDTIDAGSQDDTIFGQAGNDIINGASGADLIDGGAGDDTIEGKSQDDTIIGGPGHDIIDGGSGKDLIDGGEGNDIIDASYSDDTVTAGPGDDIIDGGTGHDLLDGGPGTDTIDGGFGNDTCIAAETNSNCETIEEGNDDPPVEDPDDPIFNDPAEIIETIPFDPAVEPGDSGFVKVNEFADAELRVFAEQADVYSFDVAIWPIRDTTTVDGVLASSVVDLQLHQAAPAFDNAVLTLGYDETLLGTVAEDDVRIWALDPTLGQWTIVPGAQEVDAETNQVAATLEHFSCYAVLVSTTGDPIADSSTCSGDIFDATGEPGLIKVPGLLIPQSTLMQPASLTAQDPNPALASSTRMRRLANGDIEVFRVDYDQVVSFNPDGTLNTTFGCNATCAKFQTAPPESIQLAVQTQNIFANDDTENLNDEEVKWLLVNTCHDANLGHTFLDCYGMSDGSSRSDASGYLDWRVANGVDPHPVRVGFFGERVAYSGFDTNTVDFLLDRFGAEGLAILSSPAAIRMHSDDDRGFLERGGVTISPQSLADTVQWMVFVGQMTKDFGTVSEGVGEQQFSFDELFAYFNSGDASVTALPQVSRDSVQWVDDNFDRIKDADYFWMDDDDSPARLKNVDLDKLYFQVTAIRLQSFASDNLGSRDLLLAMPLVTEDSDGSRKPYADRDGLDIRRLTGFENQLKLLFENALLAIDQNDRLTQHQAISRLPETYAGNRNRLITATYYEYGHAIQQWVDGAVTGSTESVARPAAWGMVASWASTGIGPALRDQLPGSVTLGNEILNGLGLANKHRIRQALADGNQWIFEDSLRQYIRLYEFIETNPNPSIAEWEQYLGAGFEDHEAIVREGVLALIASRYATDPTEQQKFMFLHNVLFGDTEQQGAQFYLDAFVLNLLPDELISIFQNAQLGSKRLNTDVDLSGTYDVDLNSLQDPPKFDDPTSGTVRSRYDQEFFESSLVCFQTSDCLDPSHQRNNPVGLSQVYDGVINFNFDRAPQPGIVDLDQIGSYDDGERGFYSPHWDDWRADAEPPDGDDVYAGSGAGEWGPFGERMWYLLNLFRLSLMDPQVKFTAYETDGGSSTNGSTFRNRAAFATEWSPETISRLTITTFDSNVPSIIAPADATGGVPQLVVSAVFSGLAAGQPASASLEAHNDGEATAHDVVATYELPPGTNNLVLSSECEVLAPFVSVIRCDFGDLGAGDQASAAVLFDIDAGADLDGIGLFGGIAEDGTTAPRNTLIYQNFLDLFDPACVLDASCSIRGGSAGDPHLVTLDGLAYDLQSVGEHVFVQSDDAQVVVQVRTEPVGPSVSVNSAVAAKVGDHRIGIYRGNIVRIDGQIETLGEGEVYDLGGGAYLARNGGRYELAWPGTGDRPVLKVRVRSLFLNVSFEAPESYAGQFSGLLGDGDGNQGNDFVFRDGTPIAQPVSNTTLYNGFGNSWRITDAESLFDYPASQGTDDFTDLAFPGTFVTLADFDAAVVAAARQQCRNAGITNPIVVDNCALDLIITQDPAFLAAFLDVVLPRGRGPLSTIRTANGDPLLIDGVKDIAVSVDNQTLYVSVPTDDQILAIDPVTGLSSVYATIDSPTYMHVDNDGDLYVIRDGGADGTLTRIDAATGAQTVLHAGLIGPSGVAVTADGAVYVIERRYTSNGLHIQPKLTLIVDPATKVQIWSGARDSNLSISDLDVDDNGTLYWREGASGRLHSYDGTTVATLGVYPTRRTATGPDGAFYYSNHGGAFTSCNSSFNNSRIWELDITNPANIAPVAHVAGGKEGFSDSTFNDPFGRLCGNDNAIQYAQQHQRLYISDAGNDAIRYIDIYG